MFNDTKVIPARLYARKPTGGKVEVFLVRGQGDFATHAHGWTESWHTLVRGLGRFDAGSFLALEGTLRAELVSRGEKGACVLRFHGIGGSGVLSSAQAIGQIPLPPYFEAARKVRNDSEDVDDSDRYQTVYATSPGAVAAPTAGLHFTPELLARLESDGHQLARVTLHVGPGTFRPVSDDDPSQHILDAEWYDVSPVSAAIIEAARREGRPIVAVGTTVVRTLETLGRRGAIGPEQGFTDILILPGERFHVVTDLITNFHLPKSSLLMLVSAFAGREPVLAAYTDAVARGYRFYSYGDAMFIRSEDRSSR